MEAFGELVSQYGLSVALLMFGVAFLVQALRLIGQGVLFVTRFSYDEMDKSWAARYAASEQRADEWKEEAKALADAAHDVSHLSRAIVRAKTVQPKP